MKHISTFVLIIFIISCNSKTERKRNVDFGGFELTLPADWSKIKLTGIDSYVGGITNGTDTLIFDYGWYSYDLGSESRSSQLFTIDTINGKIATLTKPKEKGNGTIGIYIENAYEKNHFNLIGKNITNEKLIFTIFKSIKFKNSDTTLNSGSINFSKKIIPYSGRDLFYTHCAACHFKNKKSTGPAFSSITELAFKKWILDTTYLEKKDTTEYGITFHRKTFGKLLTKTDIIKLIEYSKSE